MKNLKSLSGFEPTAVRGKWLEVKDLNHLAKDVPYYQANILNFTSLDNDAKK
jgi:hypothetical protein